MTSRTLPALLMLFVLVAAPPTPCAAQENGAGAPSDQNAGAGREEMMKKWSELATPGAPHKRLDDLVGTWETESRMWMEGPAAPPTVSKGAAEYTWVLGGRFLQQEMKGEMMGMPFTGLGLTGYDNFKKKYVGFWVDNSATAMFTMEGTVDQTGKTFTFYGLMDEWMTGEHGKMVKYVTRLLNKEKHVFEFHDLSLPDGSTKVGEITFTRKK